jgi:hypothetical protein
MSVLLRAAKNAAQALGSARAMSTGAGEGFKVGVLGAAGGIGQPLSLLMKVCTPRINSGCSIAESSFMFRHRAVG